MKFDVYAKIVGTKYVGTFEAESEEEAEQMASESGWAPSQCQNCASIIGDFTFEEFEIEESVE